MAVTCRINCLHLRAAHQTVWRSEKDDKMDSFYHGRRVNGGRGIILGNFQNKSSEIINRLSEVFPDKVQNGIPDAKEKREKQEN